MKYVVVSGGVLSGIGKGVTASSIGVLLKSMGMRGTAIKIDPYLNSDAGTMSPFEPGEVFVLDDGGEVDLDLGNYERFLDVRLGRDNNLTTGKVYSGVIERERRDPAGSGQRRGRQCAPAVAGSGCCSRSALGGCRDGLGQRWRLDGLHPRELLRLARRLRSRDYTQCVSRSG